MSEKYRLFLDDARDPKDCLVYMHRRLGKDNLLYMEEWVVVRNFDEFVKTIKERGLPEVVSFDHDLAQEHYAGEMTAPEMWEEYQKWDGRERTGYDCAMFLHEYCYWKNLPMPRWFVHSMNSVGVERITSLLSRSDYGRKQGKTQ